MSSIKLSLADIVKIARSLKPAPLIASFDPKAEKCPFCGTNRKKVKGVPQMPAGLCSAKCLETNLPKMIESMPGVIEAFAAKFAEKADLHNGATIRYLDNDYRNNNLLFWDAQNGVIVHPFVAIDDYGSVPPRFVVGDGYFNPDDWLNEVDHNTFVFPATPLITEMREFAYANPPEKKTGWAKMIVTINGKDWVVIYDPKEISGREWDSCFLEVEPAGSVGKKKFPASLTVHAGEPVWRRTIKD